MRLWGRWWLGLFAVAIAAVASGPAESALGAGAPPVRASAEAITVLAPDSPAQGSGLVMAFGTALARGAYHYPNADRVIRASWARATAAKQTGAVPSATAYLARAPRPRVRRRGAGAQDLGVRVNRSRHGPGRRRQCRAWWCSAATSTPSQARRWPWRLGHPRRARIAAEPGPGIGDRGHHRPAADASPGSRRAGRGHRRRTRLRECGDRPGAAADTAARRRHHHAQRTSAHARRDASPPPHSARNSTSDSPRPATPPIIRLTIRPTIPAPGAGIVRPAPSRPSPRTP